VALVTSPKHVSPSQNFAWLTALAGFLLFILGGVIYVFFDQAWRVYAQIGAGIGLILLLGTALLRPDAVRTVLAGRPVKYTSHAVVKSVAFLGILIFINILAAKYGGEIDLTETGRFTLSDETIGVLQQLDHQVEIVGFFRRGDPRMRIAQDHLERYSRHTDFITYEFHNPDLSPESIERYGLSNHGLLFVCGDNRHEEANVDEQSITRSLARVTGNEDSISIPAKQPTDRHIWLNPIQTNVTVSTTLILIPLTILLAGIAVWWKRR
jgi:ABC-type uncharacterized transport system involved in gliding motility auxiliary subunit